MSGINNHSIFSNRKLSLYEFVIIIHLFALKPQAKVEIRSLDVRDKTVPDWKRCLSNACTRTLHLIFIKLGGIGKWLQIDDTH